MEYHLRTKLNGNIAMTSCFHENSFLQRDRSLYKFIWVRHGTLDVEVDHVVNNDCKDELLFHEFFHVFQNGIERPPRKSVNNELEACLAQYLYSDSKSSSYFAVVIDRDFRPILVALASCIDKRTGYLKEGISYDEFHEKYVAALDFIAKTPPYNGSDWMRDQAGYNEHPFPKLVQLLNQHL